MKVYELHPGMQFRDHFQQRTNTFITMSPHPVYNGFQLVIWRLGSGEFSFDALRATQELLGTSIEFIPGDLEIWRSNVKEAIGIK